MFDPFFPSSDIVAFAEAQALFKALNEFFSNSEAVWITDALAFLIVSDAFVVAFCPLAVLSKLLDKVT